MIRKAGTLIWTASSAGWLVLAFLTHVPDAFLVSGACAIMAWAWNESM